MSHPKVSQRRSNLYNSFLTAPEITPEQVAVALFDSAKNKAPSRGLSFDLSFDYVYDRVKEGRCALTGVELEHRKHVLLPWRCSLDRLDNTIGYAEDNCIVVAKIVNASKGPYYLSDFDKMCVERTKKLISDGNTGLLSELSPEPTEEQDR
jgi:hypothetical protein